MAGAQKQVTTGTQYFLIQISPLMMGHGLLWQGGKDMFPSLLLQS